MSTRLFAAPEILACKRFTEKADIWSFGVIMFEVVQRDYPYYKDRMAFVRSKVGGLDMNLLQKISCGEILPEDLQEDRDGICGPNYAAIFRAACTFDPVKRLTAGE